MHRQTTKKTAHESAPLAIRPVANRCVYGCATATRIDGRFTTKWNPSGIENEITFQCLAEYASKPHGGTWNIVLGDRCSGVANSLVQPRFLAAGKTVLDVVSDYLHLRPHRCDLGDSLLVLSIDYERFLRIASRPIEFRNTIAFNVGPGIGFTDRCTQRRKDDFYQRVVFASIVPMTVRRAVTLGSRQE